MKVRVGKWAWIEGLKEKEKALLENLLTVIPDVMPEYGQESVPIKLYREGSDGTFGVARSYFLQKATMQHEVIDITSDGSPMSDFKSLVNYDPPREEQKVAVESILKKMEEQKLGGMILEAAPGTGKTVMSLQVAWLHGRSTMVLVHKEFLMRQWVDRIKAFFPEARIGLVWGDKCEYENVDFTIGMIQSMTSGRHSKYPKEMFDSFGLVISDEVHRIGAHTWSEVISMFSAKWRLGISATVRRKDGAEAVFKNHIGKIEYRFKTPSLIPQVKRVILNTDYEKHRVNRPNGGHYFVIKSKMKTAQHISALCDHKGRNQEIVDQIIQPLKAGRKIMVLSERLEQLKELADMLVEETLGADFGFHWRHDFYTGHWFTSEVKEVVQGKRIIEVLKKKKRSEAELTVAEGANVIFATKQMVAEALDIPALDVLVIATPISDVEQSVGRIRRICKPNDKCYHFCPWRAKGCEGKPTPIVVDIIDKDIMPVKKRWNNRAKYYVKIKAMERARMLVD